MISMFCYRYVVPKGTQFIENLVPLGTAYRVRRAWHTSNGCKSRKSLNDKES